MPQRKRTGHSTGEVYAQFADQEAMDEAMKLDRKEMNGELLHTVIGLLSADACEANTIAHCPYRYRPPCSTLIIFHRV